MTQRFSLKTVIPLVLLVCLLMAGSSLFVSDQSAAGTQQATPLPKSANPSAKMPTPVRAEETNPRWTASVRDTEAIRAFAETLLAMGHGSMTAFNRQDGQQLWHMEGLHTDKTDGKLRTIEERESTLIGVTTPKRQPQVAVILYSQRHHAHNETDYKTIKEVWESELRGIELRTGKELWRSPLELDRNSYAEDIFDHMIWRPRAVYGQTVVLDAGDTSVIARFLDARTGAVLDTARPQTLSFLRESAQLYGERYAWASPRRLIKLDPNADKPITLSSFALYGYEQLIGRVDDKMVFFVSTDDGGTGHSVWPNYVICYDVRGKQLWQFPKHIPDKWDFETLMKRYEQVETGVMHPRYRKVFVQTYKHLYLLDASTGKTLQKHSGGSAGNWQRYGKGYLDYDRDAGVLRYIDGTTGKMLKSIPLKLGRYSRLYVADQDLLCVIWNERHFQLLCYSGPSLLGQNSDQP